MKMIYRQSGHSKQRFTSMSSAVTGRMCQDIQSVDRQRAYTKEQSGKVNKGVVLKLRYMKLQDITDLHYKM